VELYSIPPVRLHDMVLDNHSDNFTLTLHLPQITLPFRGITVNISLIRITLNQMLPNISTYDCLLIYVILVK